MEINDKIRKHLLSNQYRWLITGVSGFIGSNLLEKLLELNQIVIGLDNLYSVVTECCVNKTIGFV